MTHTYAAEIRTWLTKLNGSARAWATTDDVDGSVAFYACHLRAKGHYLQFGANKHTGWANVVRTLCLLGMPVRTVTRPSTAFFDAPPAASYNTEIAFSPRCRTDPNFWFVSYRKNT